MSTVAEKAQEYFESLGPLAKKIAHECEAVKNQHNSEWANLTTEQQDDLLDNYFIDPAVKALYPQDSDQPSCYPRLKITCGEKIVVDFDNDGWTWRDEHSGPFSWYSRSEQDLTILDLEDIPAAEKEKKKGKKGKGKKKGKKQRPPPPPPPDGIQPEKSIWESPFLTADRGLDTNHAMEESQISVEDVDEQDEEEEEEEKKEPDISVTLSPSKTSTPHAQIAVDEETKLLDSSFESTAGGQLTVVAQIEQTKKDAVAPPRTKNKKKKEAPKKAPPPPPTEKRWKKQDKPSIDSAETIMTDLSISTTSPKLFQDADGGQLSPVFLEEPGESSSDPVITQQPQPKVSLSFTEDVKPVGESGQVNLALDEDEWNLPALSETKGEAVKTGFDFLDNW